MEKPVSSDASLEPLAGTVIYSGVPGTTPTARIAVLPNIDPLQPEPGALAYTVLGHVSGGSMCTMIDCAKTRAWADDVADKLRKSTISRFIRATLGRDDTLGAITINSVLEQMSFRERLFPPAHLNKDILAEAIITGMLSAARDEDPELDCAVVSYDDYVQKHRISLPKDRTGGPQREIAETAYAKPGQDVLIACGDAWDVRYAAELLPEAVLNNYVTRVGAHMPVSVEMRDGERIEHHLVVEKVFSLEFTGPLYGLFNRSDSAAERFKPEEPVFVPPLLRQFPNTVAHHAAMAMLGEETIETAASSLYDAVTQDVASYERILRFRGKPDPVTASKVMEILDQFRPYLRRVGIYDASEMEQNGYEIASAVAEAYTSREPRAAVLERQANNIAKSIRDGDAQPRTPSLVLEALKALSVTPEATNTLDEGNQSGRSSGRSR